MTSLKRILNCEDSLGLDEERYGPNSKVIRSTAEGSVSSNIQSHFPLPFCSSQSDIWDVAGRDPALFFDSNISNVDAFSSNFNFFDDELNNFVPTFPNNNDSFQPKFQPFEFQPSNPNASSNDRINVGNYGSGEGSQICYGMVSQAAVRLVGDMLKLDHKLQTTEPSYGFGFAIFDLRRENEEINLHFSDDIMFASTNTNFNKGFKDIFPGLLSRMEAVVNIQNARDRIARAKKANDAIVRVDINVFGPRENALRVGKALSDKKIWLQKPDFLNRRVDYSNPQFLELEGFEKSATGEQQMEVVSQQDCLQKDDDMFRKAVQNVFSKLTRSDQLQRVKRDQRVKTELLQHQEEGLDFMIQREFGPIPEDFCLWKREEEDGTVRYRHAVTGTTSQVQYPKTGGGVLADDMGMGKSLSILSLIAKTSTQADEWLHGSPDGSRSLTEASKVRSKATLIIVSSSLLINEWEHEMKKHLDGSIGFVKYHGMKRRSLKDGLKTTDIILTTYNTLVRDFQDRSRRKYNMSLHEIDFFRVVLDEAHVIRRKGSLFNKSVSELSAKLRWCLTGTPIQNKFEDIGALFAFIQARPFHNVGMFRRFISNPFNESNERRAIAVKRLVALIDSLCIRRTKTLLRLPDSQDIRKELEFTFVERRQYDKAVSDMSRTLRQQVGDSKSKFDFGLFQVNLQLRILCNHGTYQSPFAWIKNAWLDMGEYALPSMITAGEVKCSYCKQVMPVTSARNIYRLYGEDCRHAICELCLGTNLDGVEETEGEIKCPVCVKIELNRGVGGRSTAKRANDEEYFLPNGYSTKMTFLVNDLRENLSETKSIVFSCWTRTLELISRHLINANIEFKRIDGQTSIKEREGILEEFSERKDLPVLIMTTGTGAYGLNLTAANRIFIIEPQWNPAVENQAISRAIRLGQANAVQVTRYFIKHTVEQEMCSQQNRKIMLAGLLDQSPNDTTTEQDLYMDASDVEEVEYSAYRN